MGLPVIVTFANQKGGVGKTSLCVAFANYLAVKGVKVAIVDCDPQKSILNSRETDIVKYGVDFVPYPISFLCLDNPNEVLATVAQLQNDPTLEVVVMDAPGSQLTKGLMALFINTDLLIVPFHYDYLTIASTARFLIVVESLREKMNNKMTTKLFILPNMDHPREGTKEERDLWEKTRDTFSQYGVVTPKIRWRANMRRLSTIINLDGQFDHLKPIYGIIYREIFGSLQNRRNHNLQEQNLDPKRQKKLKKKNEPISEDPSQSVDSEE